IGAAENRETVSALVEKYQHFRMADRAFDLAWTHSQVILRQLNATEAEAQLYARLAGAIIYADPARRATSGILLENRRGQSALWAYGISGDTPLVLLRITDLENIELVRQLIHAHSYWRAKGLTVELEIGRASCREGLEFRRVLFRSQERSFMQIPLAARPQAFCWRIAAAKAPSGPTVSLATRRWFSCASPTWRILNSCASSFTRIPTGARKV